MSSAEVDDLSNILFNTFVGEGGVSFQGRTLKLDSEDDAVDIVQAINNCKNLEYLNLEGNTLGVDAAKAVAKALESHSEFKRALWKDLFTGRMKEEIPKALQFLGSGLVLAGARLTELDLSDNAFGPIGVQGLAALLRSSTCFALQVLRLNNNGLGVTGAKLLSKALIDCYQSSKAEGHPFALRVFIAGRNRLENEGAKALSEVFKLMGSLEELNIPQNGIYHAGITALSEALISNPNLRVLNLNDNLMTVKGSAALAKALPSLQKLREIDLGDCLLKTKGAMLLATAVADQHVELEDLNLSYNEIKLKAGLALIEAMQNKPNLKVLLLVGNQFSEPGKEELRSRMQSVSRIEALGSLSGDEEGSEEEDEEENSCEVEESDSEESDKDDEADQIQPLEQSTPSRVSQNGVKYTDPVAMISVAEFMESPTAVNFKSLGDNKEKKLLVEVHKHLDDPNFRFLLELLMKVSSLSTNAGLQNEVLACSNVLYQTFFNSIKKRPEHEYGLHTNELMVYLGLVKSEDKLKLTWNTDSCFISLNKAIQQDYFPASLEEMVHVFLSRQVIESDDDVQILTPPK